MTRKSAIAHLSHKIIGCKTFGASKADGVNLVALEMATNALEQIKAIEDVIDVSNITIQEDVRKYKIIVDIVKGGCQSK